MCKKLICLVFLVFALICGDQAAVLANLDDDLVLHLPFDEGGGTVAADISQSGFQATLEGDYKWTSGKFGQAVTFTGGRAEISESDSWNLPHLTAMAWINPVSIVPTINSNHWSNINLIYGKAGSGPGDVLTLALTGGDDVFFWINAGGNQALSVPDAGVQTGQWQHIAATFDGTAMRVFLDGEQIGEMAAQGSINTSTQKYVIGGRTGGSENDFDGAIDDLKVFDRALTTQEIQRVFTGTSAALASNPSPADGETDVIRDVILSWTSGESAKIHDVYIGTGFDDVNDANTSSSLGVLASQGQNSNTYSPEGLLDLGQTYYWRVDEVNDVPDYKVYKGDVWQFTIEPIAYSIENVTATASGSNSEEEGPENTVNGSGLDAGDAHSTMTTDMWLSKPGTWIEYEFDKLYKLHQMWVWNYNGPSILTMFGLKNVTIEYSVDGANYETLGGNGNTYDFDIASGQASYLHNTQVNFDSVVAKFVKITVNSNHSGDTLDQHGLSEVRFFYIPVWSREPNPSSGATDLGVDDVIVSWRAGREAASHNLYFSSDEQAVIDETVNPVSFPADSSYAGYDVGSLVLGQTYYWKVNEVNEAEITSTWAGNIWNFTAREYLIVDDVESYNDLDTDDPNSNRIYTIWIDGFEDTTNGSQLGRPEDPFNVPFTEQTIVHGGSQSMSFMYDNSIAGYSEVTADPADLAVGRDWTKREVTTLSLWFSGQPDNSSTEQMYVKLNGTKVPYDGAAENLTQTEWQLWNIDLISAGVKLSNVTELGIGFERTEVAGGKGVIYFDDIRLYPLGGW